jgi:excisionase family DNA binding protein
MEDQIHENKVYTLEETNHLLKISRSTFLRLVKKGLLRAGKVWGQYRVLGKEIIRVVSPRLEDKARKVFRKVKEWAKEGQINEI